MHTGILFMFIYAAFNSSISLLITTMEQIGYFYLGYVVLATLYLSFGLFSLFSASHAAEIKSYSKGFAYSSLSYIAPLFCGYVAVYYHEQK